MMLSLPTRRYRLQCGRSSPLYQRPYVQWSPLYRQQHGQPYLRLSMILGAVSVFTLAAALLLETPRLRRALRKGGSAGPR